MDDLREKLDELNALIIEFRYDEALDKFYAEDIITHENEEPPIEGLAAYKKAGKAFVEEVSDYSAELRNIIVSDNMSVVEWHYSFNHRMAGPWNRTQISVQRWKNGKIVHERHHWNR